MRDVDLDVPSAFVAYGNEEYFVRWEDARGGKRGRFCWDEDNARIRGFSCVVLEESGTSGTGTP